MSGPGHVVAGRYRLLERIGGGGMGAVWLASDELLGRRVAVKQVLPPPTADEAVIAQQRQRALREGRIAARLSHPHAVVVYDVAVEDGAPWLVMEYLPSRSLAEVLHQDGVLPVDQVAQIGAQVADALSATHAAGIVHRDVKPANVLIGQGPRVEGLVKITDFGISHARDDVTLTQTGQITGTPAFLAPEVARGGEVTPESDVFSLGATLYTCLEGQPPFGMDDNALRLLHRVAAGELIPPRRAGSMTAPLMRMLAVDPADRPTTTQVRDELARLAVGRDGDPTTVLLARTKLRSSSNRERTEELSSGVLPAAGAGAAAAAGYRDPGTAVHVSPTGPPPA
ncbi:MAG TPA: serine/threonine-protein kinase, partial [Geodermatophilus sp.]|nr:serine/threonine-protein kinase [Geodermatophilus sp.]